MNRRYRISDFIKTVEKVRQARPGIAITTDVIVGFPGETDAEFDETVALIRAISFSELHVFPFSKRENTAAAKMSDQVESEVKKKRVNTLLKISEELHRYYEQNYYGKTLDVLFEDFNEADQTYRGHTSNYLEVRLKSRENLSGKVSSITYRGPKNSELKKA